MHACQFHVHVTNKPAMAQCAIWNLAMRVKFALMTFAGYECVYWVVIKQWQYMIVLILVGHTSDIEYIEERHRLERIPVSNDCRFSLGNTF